ncbi:MAG: helix-turn-helix domain-containing protein [Hyphomicrobium sp.]
MLASDSFYAAPAILGAASAGAGGSGAGRGARLRSVRSPWDTVTALDLAPDDARRAIEFAVIRVFGVEPEKLIHLQRGKKTTALARQVAMYLAHVACRLSLTDVGRMFARDRTTVAHACAVVEDRRDDPTFDRVLDLLEWAVPNMVARPIASLTD